MLTSKRMRMLSLALLLVALLLTFLTGCAGLKPFPTKELYEFDPRSKVCALYTIVDEEKMQWQWVRDIPAENCVSIFGFKTSDIPNVINWVMDAREYSKRK